MSDFLVMGGYGVYVWPAYTVFLLALLVDTFAPVLARRRMLKALRGRLHRQVRREGTAL